MYKNAHFFFIGNVIIYFWQSKTFSCEAWIIKSIIICAFFYVDISEKFFFFKQRFYIGFLADLRWKKYRQMKNYVSSPPHSRARKIKKKKKKKKKQWLKTYFSDKMIF